jgi:hypothetical protein
VVLAISLRELSLQVAQVSRLALDAQDDRRSTGITTDPYITVARRPSLSQSMAIL